MRPYTQRLQFDVRSTGTADPGMPMMPKGAVAESLVHREESMDDIVYTSVVRIESRGDRSGSPGCRGRRNR